MNIMARFIHISSYNLRGFQQGQQQLLKLCNNHDVIAIQKHWLADCDLNKIVNLNNDLSVIARSAMSDKLQQSFYVVGFLAALR